MNGKAIALAALLALGPQAAQAGTKLTVFEWEGYISLHEKDFEAYAKSKGRDIDLEFVRKADGSVQYIGNADDIVQALAAGKADIVTPTHNYYQQEQGKLIALLAPVDTAKIENYGDVYPVLRDLDAFKGAGGKVHGVPLLGGSYALAYNAAKGPGPKSWQVLLDPTAKGTFQITSDQYEANIYQAALLAGVKADAVFDVEKMTPEQKAKTQEILNKLVANAAGFWGGMPDKAAMKDLRYVTDYWFGVAAANADGQKWAIPRTEEPVTVWLDTLAIAKQAAASPEKMEAAHLLFGYLVGVQAQQKIAEAFGSVIVNGKARALVGAALPGDEFFTPALFWRPLSAKTRIAYREMWDAALKASGKKA
ncbi:MAG TPA: ABC transporter substrate-binding protein [Azospirillaceae bacterium]|nr:ABC transporter substrate-binding protein [Azospirillaceae bacterium]